MVVVDALRQRLERIRSASVDEKMPLKEWIEHSLSLSPWQVWTLLALVRHRSRQQFVADAARCRLGADLDAIAAAAALGHPNVPQQGVVPGLSEWEYFFHGRGCCLTHRTRGEAIDVDFYDSTADWFDDFFFINYLKSLKSPSFVEERLISLHASFSTVRLAIDELLEMGLLERLEDRKVFRLAFAYETLSELLEEIERLWPAEPIQLAMAAAVGDWFLFDGLAKSEDWAQQVKDKRDVSRKQRTDRLITQFRARINQIDNLYALQDLGSSTVPAVLTEALRGTPSGTTSVAMEVIHEWDDPKWGDEVEKLMRRLHPNGEIPQPYIWQSCAQFLAKHNRTAGIERLLRKVSSNCLGDCSILALEYFPDIAVETFRRALRSEIPCNRITAAAALAIIDQPWSRAELAAVLKECSDHVKTSECRSALLTTHSRECQELVNAWDAKHPREPEPGPFITMDEMVLRHSDGSINWEMEKLHARVLPLRSKTPTQPKRSWWKS